MKNLRSVLLVGRTNVGKSTLFNRLSSRVKSMTFDQEGVTRDYITDLVQWRDVEFELIDSAGLCFRKYSDPLEESVRQGALKLLERAQVIVFVVDGKAGLLPEDQEIARALHKTGKPVIVAVNKMDTKLAQEQQYEFQQLGYETYVPISAQHGINIDELLDSIIEQVKTTKGRTVEEKPSFKVTLLGKPNVGKSSLMNALLNRQRALVTEVAGTTREPLTENITFYHDVISVTDTPGIRRKRSVGEDLEKLMVKSSLSAVRTTDVVLLLVDASEGGFADQELKLAFYAFDDQKKALVILFNKYDLITDELRDLWKRSLDVYSHFFRKIHMMNISCKDGKNVGKLIPLLHDLWETYHKELSNEELTLLFQQALQKAPLHRQGKVLKVHRAEFVKTGPPMIALIVNYPEFFGPSQLMFFENILRDYTNLKSIPVKIVIRTKS